MNDDKMVEVPEGALARLLNAAVDLVNGTRKPHAAATVYLVDGPLVETLRRALMDPLKGTATADDLRGKLAASRVPAGNEIQLGAMRSVFGDMPLPAASDLDPLGDRFGGLEIEPD